MLRVAQGQPALALGGLQDALQRQLAGRPGRWLVRRSRPASRAPSFMTLARSAPVRPMARAGDGGQVDARSPAACARRAGRGWPGGPPRRAAPGPMVRSKRPGRSRAGSRMSGRLVAASTMMPSVVENPSISARIWLSACSCSPWPRRRRRPRPGPADGVELVDEDDGRGVLPGLGEQVAHPGRAHARRRARRSRSRRWR